MIPGNSVSCLIDSIPSQSLDIALPTLSVSSSPRRNCLPRHLECEASGSIGCHSVPRTPLPTNPIPLPSTNFPSAFKINNIRAYHSPLSQEIRTQWQSASNSAPHALDNAHRILPSTATFSLRLAIRSLSSTANTFAYSLTSRKADDSSSSPLKTSISCLDSCSFLLSCFSLSKNSNSLSLRSFAADAFIALCCYNLAWHSWSWVYRALFCRFICCNYVCRWSIDNMFEFSMFVYFDVSG